MVYILRGQSMLKNKTNYGCFRRFVPKDKYIHSNLCFNCVFLKFMAAM